MLYPKDKQILTYTSLCSLNLAPQFKVHWFIEGFSCDWAIEREKRDFKSEGGGVSVETRDVLSGRIASEAFYGPKPSTAQHCIKIGENWTLSSIAILMALRVRLKSHTSVVSY